ncbi:DNA-directed RNA polymerase subunit omega [Butyrivibrio sp. AE2032]|uniref:DNA-directed RNA polymerase subunit omega n=1 Tax=Butyrivibrio sp. AE2032 TaxID=1458463 RepID=UPI000835FCBA|nr:DNA-directed RNA polymerase subunit omega [Butyrivibrio sp. AE2032]
MLTDPSIEKLKEKSASPYDLTVLVSKRARELTDGAQPMIDDANAANVVSLACREVAADKVVAVKGDVEDEAVIPITREEKIRRREEAENKRKMMEEERAERMSVAGGLNSKGLDDLIDALAGGEPSDEEFVEGESEDEPEDEE